MKKLNAPGFIVLLLVIVMGGPQAYAVGPTTVPLGTADNFAVLAGSTITNTGMSGITGDLGLSPGTSVTGFPPGTLNGTQHVADAAALQAQNDLTNAYTNAVGQTPVSTIGTELGGTTQGPGVYDSASGTFGINGTLILDAQGDPNAVFIFKTASTLITAGSSTVVLTNNAQACNVFWQVGSSVTLGTNSTFKGNILALTSATITTGANVQGRILARNAAVTIDSGTITKATCVAAVSSAAVSSAISSSSASSVSSSSSRSSTRSSSSSSSSSSRSSSSSSSSRSSSSSSSSSSRSSSIPLVQSSIVSSTPTFPNTGFGSDNFLGMWNTVLAIGMSASLLALFAIQKRESRV